MPVSFFSVILDVLFNAKTNDKMDPILLKTNLNHKDINELIHKGVNDMDISPDKRNKIESEATRLSAAFAKAIRFHMEKGKQPDASYAFQIAILLHEFTENFRLIFINAYKKDVLTGFGISAIWMSILNGLDAESGIMPNHPLKREIGNSLRSIHEILDNKG